MQCTIFFVTTRMQRRPNSWHPCTTLSGVCKRVCETLLTFANGPAVIAPLVTINLRAGALQKTSMGVIDKAMLATQEAGIRSQQHPNSFYPLESEMVGRNRTWQFARACDAKICRKKCLVTPSTQKERVQGMGKNLLLSSLFKRAQALGTMALILSYLLNICVPSR